MKGVLLIGAGALARDIIDLVGADRFAAAYVDPQFAVASVSGVPVVTSWEEARQRASHYILATSNIAHREIARRLATAAALLPAPAVISALARIASDARIGAGCVVGHFAVIGPTAHLGEDTLVMHSAIVAHDSVVEECSVICAGACVNGNVRIGPRCFIGPNAVLVPKLQFGHDSVVAAGAACFRDAPAHSFLVGNPARRSASPSGSQKD